MIVAPPTSAAYSLAAYLSNADMVDSTTASCASAVVEEVLLRSYAGTPSWGLVGTVRPVPRQSGTKALHCWLAPSALRTRWWQNSPAS